MSQSSEEQQFRIFALGLDAYLYIAKFLFPQQIYCINLKGTVSASSLFSSRQLATCSSRPPRRGGGVRSRASSTPNCILEWKIRGANYPFSLSHREKELVSNHRHKALRVHRRVLTIIEEDRHNVLTVRHILQVHCPLLGDALTYLASAYL